jgi:hypothetical protein
MRTGQSGNATYIAEAFTISHTKRDFLYEMSQRHFDLRRPKWCSGWVCWLLLQRSRVSHGPFQKVKHWIDNPVLEKINHVSNNLYAELEKSSTYSHTWLGINPQTGRPLSRMVVPLIYWFIFHYVYSTFMQKKVYK